MAISTENARNLLKSSGDILLHSTADLLSSSDFISRTIGMNNSYEDIMLLVQALGRQPISLLGKDYVFIFDHVRRIYEQGVTVPSVMYGGEEYGCTKFTFYKERPTVKFADVYNDPLNLLARWIPDISLNSTKSDTTNKFYAESNDGKTNNKSIDNVESSPGTASGQYSSSFQNLTSCDLIKKTNDNFLHGKFNTLVARFHTNNDESKDTENPTQTAVSKTYGMSHGRNLLKITPDEPNGYDNPYCRVWTYHHQYHRMADAIRPFGGITTADQLEKSELSGDYTTVGFRTSPNKDYDIEGGSNRLDRHGVLNYENGFVNIAPTAKIKDYFEGKEDDKDRKSVSVKKCMFSIENLAWRDDKAKPDQYEPYGLSAEQRGPLGGRIMWFPPYDINFNENVSVKWNSNEFIGRGENIYTYTNTERRGNLSFTLVIDHPSILDYWTGHEKNGMKNGGKTLLPGNDGGVDEKNNQEQTLLRFFAGCDILTAKPQTYWTREKKLSPTPDDPVKQDLPQPNPVEPDEAKPVSRTLYCVLYYPNNYSGVNDLPNTGGTKDVNAIYYLMNGIGTQKYVNKNNNAVDIPTVIDVAPGGDGSGHGGYEINGNISITNETLETVDAKKSTYTFVYKCEKCGYSSTTEFTTCEKCGNSDPKKIKKVSAAQYLTSGNGSRYTVTYGDSGFTLAKIVGSQALPYARVSDKYWFQKRWYYRVDKAYENDVLTAETSYIDVRSLGLNGSGYNEIRTTPGEKPNVPEEGGDAGVHLISFADLFCALEGDKNKVVSPVNPDDVELVKKIVNGKDNGIKIKKISFRGHASTAGRGTLNTTLSRNRAETFKAWMMGAGFPKPEKGDAEALSPINQSGKQDHINNGDANKPLAKIWRSASVCIEYEETEITSAKNDGTVAQTDENGKAVKDSDRSDGTILNKKDNITNKSSVKLVSPGKINTARDWLYNTEDGAKLRRDGYFVMVEKPTLDGKGTMLVPEHRSIDPLNFNMRMAEEILGKNFTDNTKTDYDDSYKQQGEVVASTVERYDNEGEFFQLLEKKSPFLHHLITDKIKYFDPAYHAISPEGFNARLTFLHQCTRQGATIGNSDPDVTTAYNLAFGRPPVCVLRLGDFYYTKIIINSMTINYDSPQWDLNPEGIGVMPMFAKINIDFNFIGGSDLAGPIARLQNAVSFNYYANTGVYDDRAEKVEYDPSKTGKEVAYKPYNYPDGEGRKVADNNKK